MRSAAITVLLAGAPTVWAHDPGLSTLTLRAHGVRLTAVVRLNRADLQPIDADRTVALETLAPAMLELAVDGRLVAATATRATFKDGHALVQVGYDVGGGRTLVLRSRWLERLAFGHKQLARLEGPEGDVLAERLLGAAAPALEAPLTGVSSPARAVGFFRLGVEHILTGADHLLFLATVLLACPRPSGALRLVSAFTAAHSLTLALATVGRVRIPPALVEPAIAGSVVVAAVLNLLGSGVAERVGLTFAFGLVHGLGFASALADLEVGPSLGPVLRSLAAFTGGVEVGQMAVAALVLPAPWILRRWTVFGRAALRACSLVAALVGCVWLVERTLGWS